MNAKPEDAIEALQNTILPLRQSEFSPGLGKVSVYVQSVAKSLDSSRNALKALEQKKALDNDIYPQEVQPCQRGHKDRFSEIPAKLARLRPQEPGCGVCAGIGGIG